MLTKTKNIILLISLSIYLLFCGACQADEIQSTDYIEARKAMVEEQIQARGVFSPDVIDAMLTVPRHLFVPERYRDEAYKDHPLPIGESQTISQPYIVALMTDLLKPDAHDKILEIGTGSGYQAAVLGELVDEVYTVEIVEPLAKRSAALLDSLGYNNIVCRCGDGYIGWEEHAPYDGIIVTCAPPYIPQPLIEQLADGGRMVIPVGEFYQELYLIEKEGETLTHIRVIPVRFVPMTGEAEKN